MPLPFARPSTIRAPIIGSSVRHRFARLIYARASTIHLNSTCAYPRVQFLQVDKYRCASYKSASVYHSHACPPSARSLIMECASKTPVRVWNTCTRLKQTWYTRAQSVKFLWKNTDKHAIRNTGVLGVTSTPGFWGKITDFQKIGAKWQILTKIEKNKNIWHDIRANKKILV